MAAPRLFKRGRVLGSLLGLAVGDAVGTAVESMPPGSFSPVQDMNGGGKFNLMAGQWTDDTSMALCLAESLIECQAFNPIDQSKRYWRWYQEGHLSSNGECFDVGKTVLSALNKFRHSNEREPYCGPTSEWSAGNGSLMRLCPVPLLYHKHPTVAMDLARKSSRTTHGPKAALDACSYFSGLIVGCLQGAEKEELLTPYFSPTGSKDYWENNPMVPEVATVVAGSYKQLEPPAINASAYVVQSLQAVLWAFYHTHNFRDGCLKVVNLGGDADTVGAIYGQLAGAYYGVDAIPEDWKEKCSLSPLIEVFATELLTLADSIQVQDLPDSTDWNSLYLPLPESKCERGHDSFRLLLWRRLCNNIFMSDLYVNLKLKGYDLLESRNKEIVRKLNPCPKAYKKLEDFDEDVAALKKMYGELPEECQDAEILMDFQRRWSDSRTKLELRLELKLKRGW